MNRRSSQKNPLEPTHHWWHRYKISTQKFAVLLTLTAFVSGGGYVLLTNGATTQGFAIKQAQDQLTKLQAQNEKLQLQAADLQALSVADQASARLQLTSADRFEYLPPTTGTVARR